MVFKTALCVVCLVSSVAARTILERPRLPRELPISTLKQGVRKNADGNLEYFDREPRIEFDEPKQRYLLSFRTAADQRKTMIYDPPNKLAAAVTVVVESKEDGFFYNYGLENLPTSDQKLQGAYVEARSETIEGKPPNSTIWRSVRLTKYLRDLLHFQNGWEWTDIDENSLGIAPGTRVVGFVIQSKGLPSVVHIKAFARRTSVTDYTEEAPDALLEAVRPLIWNLPSGYTLGPGKECNAVANCIEHLDTELKNAIDLGWVKSDFDYQAAVRQLKTFAGPTPSLQTAIADLRSQVANDSQVSEEMRILLQTHLTFISTIRDK
jgi:hypothetical protein